jgi:protocatechuate 3,4-dioxygenase beta subunit
MTRASAAIVLGLVSGMMVQAGGAQTPVSITVRGQVISAETGDPIRNARVGIADGPDAPAALTDGEGRFALASVPPGQRELLAAKTGYVRSTVPVSASAEIRLIKGGVISGRVLDDLGEPMPLMNVAVFRLRRAGASVTFERFRATESDDQGEYRLFGLPAGEFVVAPAPGRYGAATTTIPINLENLVFHNYYPHAETPEQAQPIAVKAGEETPGINFTAALPPPGPQLTSGGPPPQSPLPPQRLGGTAAIEGRVVNANGLPIRRARVQIVSGEQLFTPYLTSTDDDGRYEFRGLKPGNYFINAGSLGDRPAPFSAVPGSELGDKIAIEAGETRSHVDIFLPHRGVISGRILDEYGDPMANANVRLDLVLLSRGRRRVVPAPSVTTRNTDDRGRYRLFGLAPGKYIVAAVVGESVPGWQTADWPGYALTYFPGTPTPAEAQAVELAAGQQALNVEFSLVHGRLARISGLATLSDGSPLQGIVALMQSAGSGAIATPPVHVQTNADGSFVFERIPPGEYVVQSSTRRSTVSSEGEFAAQFVTVDGTDLTGLAVHLSAGSTIEGKVTFDGGDPPEDPDFHISPVPADPDLASLVDNAPARADIHDDWTFEISGVNGPRRLQLTQAPEGWALKAIRVGGIDATDTVFPFGTADQSLRDVEVMLTKRLTALTVTQKGPPRPYIRFVAFATDAARRYPGSRYMAIGVPAGGGEATLKGLPPGEYYVAALGMETLTVSTAFDEGEFLESLVAGATRITLTEGESRSVSVGVIRR